MKNRESCPKKSETVEEINTADNTWKIIYYLSYKCVRGKLEERIRSRLLVSRMHHEVDPQNDKKNHTTHLPISNSSTLTPLICPYQTHFTQSCTLP